MDISMCFGEGCPKKETCYRYRATPNELRQSYGMFEANLNNGKCDYYWEVGKDNGSLRNR